MLWEPRQSEQCHPCPHPFGELCMPTLGPCESLVTILKPQHGEYAIPAPQKNMENMHA